ncbi:hypothetical protein C6501_03920 [Candidatus Poribacteria bacterium]|nr:MAG: hypothetical protein C6501_03920 [Candidatus Poribacteria bacterium]
MHWQPTLGSAAVRGTITLAEPPVKGFTDAKIDYSRNQNKMQHFFYLIFVIQSHVQYEQDSCQTNLSDIGRKNGDSSINYVKNSKSFAKNSTSLVKIKIRRGFARKSET